MDVTSTAITGAEKLAPAAEPLNALVDFYRAFNHRNLELMRLNWARTEEVSMSNPLGGIKRGWAAIEAAYSKIFNGPAKVYVEFYDYTVHRSAEMFYALGHERGYFELNATRVDLAIRTSRVYRMERGRWHQVHHHGSIDNPDLLRRYQEAVHGVTS